MEMLIYLIFFLYWMTGKATYLLATQQNCMVYERVIFYFMARGYSPDTEVEEKVMAEYMWWEKVAKRLKKLFSL